MKRLILIVMMVTALLAVVAEAESAAVEWANAFSCGNMDEQPGSVMLKVGRKLFVVGRSSARVKQEETQKFVTKNWVWEIDESGKRISEKPFDLDNPITKTKIEAEKCFPTGNEGEFLVYETEKFKSVLHLIKVSGDGELKLVGSLKMMYLPRVAAAQKDGIVVAGADYSNEHDAWMMKIDGQGQRVWEKTYNNGQNEEIMGVAIAENGDIVFSANSGQNNKFGAGECNVWVVRCDKEGKVLEQKSFPGRHPSVAISTKGTIAVAYNRQDFPKQDIRVVGLDSKLRETWRVDSLLSDDIGVGLTCTVAGVPDGFAVASGGGNPILGRIGEKGKVAWKISVPLPENAISAPAVETVLSNRGRYIVGSIVGYMPTISEDPNGRHVIDSDCDQDDILVAKVKER